MEIVHLTERNQASVVERVASLLKRGGVVAIPTDTVYGLAADILHEPAVKKVFRIKKRSHIKAVPMFIRDVAMAKEYAYLDAKLARLLDELWPGQTTVVLRRRNAMPDLVVGGARTVGLRVPDYPFLNELLLRYPHPLTATSANLSGSEPASSAVQLQSMFRRHITRPDLIVDGGTLPPSPSSTVIDLTLPENPRILRMGAVTKQKLEEFLAQWNRLKL